MNVSDTGGQGRNQRHHQKVGRDGGGHTFDQEGKSGLKIYWCPGKMCLMRWLEIDDVNLRVQLNKLKNNRFMLGALRVGSL